MSEYILHDRKVHCICRVTSGITFKRSGNDFQKDKFGIISIPLAPFLKYNTILPIVRYERNPMKDLQKIKPSLTSIIR